MASRLVWLWSLLLISALACVSQPIDEEEPPRIGIIGAGIGGTTAAYYIRELFGDAAIIDVFEQDRVGGRMRSINIDGLEYEAGGAVLHPLNEYMVNFTRMFGLEQLPADGGTLGFFGSDGMRAVTSSWTFVTLAKLIWRYGYDIVKIRSWVEEHLLTNFFRIYKLQNSGIAYTTVEDMLRAMDEEFVRYTRITINDLMKEAGFGDTFINEVVHSAMRNNYGQDNNITGFVGAVSLAGVQPGLFSVKGGNKLIPEKLLKKSKANLINGKVSQVLLQKDGDGVTYEVTYKLADADTKSEDKAREYDIVVMATPLPTGQTEIKFEDFTQPLPLPQMELHNTIALFVQGILNTSYFGYENEKDFPDEIFTVDDKVFFNSLGKKDPVSYKEHFKKSGEDTGEEVYKVFLNKVPSEPEIRSLFKGRKDLRLVNWKAYPQYDTKTELPPFVLYDRLYYVNAIETAASAMEMSAISGRNVALLAFNHWFSHFDRIDEVSLEKTSETKEEL